MSACRDSWAAAALAVAADAGSSAVTEVASCSMMPLLDGVCARLAVTPEHCSKPKVQTATAAQVCQMPHLRRPSNTLWQAHPSSARLLLSRYTALPFHVAWPQLSSAGGQSCSSRCCSGCTSVQASRQVVTSAWDSRRAPVGLTLISAVWCRPACCMMALRGDSHASAVDLAEVPLAAWCTCLLQ